MKFEGRNYMLNLLYDELRHYGKIIKSRDVCEEEAFVTNKLIKYNNKDYLVQMINGEVLTVTVVDSND